MPLSARARVELYLPNRQTSVYENLRSTIVSEFTNVFGGCTVLHGDGSYLADSGVSIKEGIFVVYTDTDFDFQENFEALGEYADKLRQDVYRALEEEEILVTVCPVYHSER